MVVKSHWRTASLHQGCLLDEELNVKSYYILRTPKTVRRMILLTDACFVFSTERAQTQAPGGVYIASQIYIFVNSQLPSLGIILAYLSLFLAHTQ